MQAKPLIPYIVLFLLAGCAKQQEEARNVAATEAAYATADAAVSMVEDSNTDKTAQLSSTAITYTDTNRQFIRTASANFQVKDVYQSANAIEDIATAQGGYVVKNTVSSNIQKAQRFPIGNAKILELTEYIVQGDLSVRIPSEKTQDFLRAIINQIEFLDSRSFEARDAQLDLLRKQLEIQRNQQAAQALGNAAQDAGKPNQKAAAIMARNDAQSARDEALIAQKEFQDSIAFSSIDLSIYQLAKVRRSELADVEAIFKQNRPLFIYRLGHALNIGWQWMLEAFLMLITLWPLWLLLIAMSWGYFAFKKKRSAKM